MRRRDLIKVVGGAAVAWPLAVRAQQMPMPVIGYLNSSMPTPALLDEFRNGLAENGYYESQNVVIEYRWAEGRYDRLPAFAAELVRRRVDVIVATGGAVSGLAAKAATNTIPIVILSGGDPVKLGLVSSLSRPGGNVTGVSQLVTAVEHKRLEFLRELVPSADTIAFLENPTFSNSDLDGALGVNISVLKASSEGDISAAFGTIVKNRIGALLIGADPFFFMQRDQLVALSDRNAVPTMYFFREFVVAGGLISYGTRLVDGHHMLGVYTGRILKGAKPADLPIAQQSEKIELIINLKAANALRLIVPPSLLAGADEVIE